MSAYLFISCNDLLPGFLRDKKQFPEGGPMIIFENSDDTFDLRIFMTPNDKAPYDIKYYTDRRYIYTIEGECTNENCSVLADYIKSLQISGSMELWYVWLCNLEDIPKELKKLKVFECDRKDVNGNLLSEFFKCYGSGDLPKVLKLL